MKLYFARHGTTKWNDDGRLQGRKDSDLTEEGIKLSQIERDHPKEYHTYMTDPENYIPLGGETLDGLFLRVQAFLDEISGLNYKNIMVVSHGVTIKAILTIIKGLTLKDLSSLPVYTGTALNICEFSKGKFELLREGDISHLQSEVD